MDLIEENLSYYDIEKEIRYSGIKVKMLDFCSVTLYLSENKVKNKQRKIKLWKEIFRKHTEYCSKNKITDAIPIIIKRKDFLFLFEDLKDKNKVFEWDRVMDMSFRSQIKIIGPKVNEEQETEFHPLGENLYKKFLVSKFDLTRLLIELTYYNKTKSSSKKKIEIINEILNVQNFARINKIDYTELFGKDVIYLFDVPEKESYQSLKQGVVEPLRYCYSDNLNITNPEIKKEINRTLNKYFSEQN